MDATLYDRVGKDAAGLCITLNTVTLVTSNTAVFCAKNSDICFDTATSQCKKIGTLTGSVGIEATTFYCLYTTIVANPTYGVY